MKYLVRFFAAVRLDPVEVEAETQEEAIALAEEKINVREAIYDRRCEDDESAPLGALVDEVDDLEYRHTRYHEGAGARGYLGSTPK